MAATFDPTLPSTRDWVRFLIQDVTVATAMLQDEEIDAVIAEQYQSSSKALKYLAAAECLSVLHLRWMTGGHGVASKKVDQLSIVYGTAAGINVDMAVTMKIKELRARGAWYMEEDPKIFFAHG